MPRRYNVLGREPGCSLQEAARGAASPAVAEAAGCARPQFHGIADRLSGNPDGRRATCADCRERFRRIRDPSRSSCDGIRRVAAAGSLDGRRRFGPGGTLMVRRTAGKNDNNDAATEFPRIGSCPIFRGNQTLETCIEYVPHPRQWDLEITAPKSGALVPAHRAEIGSVSPRP
jgi:hypothetical protein